MRVRFKKLDDRATLPFYSKPGDNGLDLIAVEKETDERGVITYDTKIAVEIPEGYVGIITPRSSIHGYDCSLANSVGTIDSNYRGSIKLKFKPDVTEVWREEYNSFSNLQWQFIEGHSYQEGDKIGQLLILPCPQIVVVESDELSETERGSKGFGSSGK